MTFLTEAKRILSEFVSETRESLHYVKTELLRQYHLSIIKEIKETYPTTYPYIDTVYKIVDGLAQDDAPDTTYFRVVAKDTQSNSAASPVSKLENGVVTTIANSIIVWDSGFADTVYSVGVVLAKEGDSYRILDYIRDKLEIIGQLQEIRNFASKYPEAKVGIVPQANGAAILRLLQSEFPDIIEAKLALGDRTKVEQAIMERKLLTVPPSFNEFDEWKRIVNWGIGYLAIDSLTNVDLTNLKEGDRLTNRWGNDSAFETPEETEFFNSKIANDGLNEPDYPYDTEPSA